MKSYFKFLSRNKLYTLIEVVGMAVAMAFVVFISTFVMDGYFTDRHIRQRGNMCVGYVSQYFNYTYRTADLLKGRFPEVEEMCRMMVTRQLRGVEMDVVREEGDEHQNALVVDDNFFEMFPFPLREGRAADVLKGDKIVLSESYARQLFPEGDAVGKTLKIKIDGKESSLAVSGIFRDFCNTTLPAPDIIYNFEQIRRLAPFLIHDGNCTVALFFRLTDEADVEALGVKMNEVMQKEDDMMSYFGTTYTLVRWDDIAGIEDVQAWDPFQNIVNPRFTSLFTAEGFLLLLFAVLNYISLTTAQTGFRAKEMAMRRLLGTQQSGVVMRYIAETFLLTLLSLGLALLLVKFFTPYFCELIQHPVNPLSGDLWGGKMLFALAFIVLLSFCSGIIPAMIISKFKPIDIVRGTFTRVSKMTMGKVLVAMQCFVAFVTLSLSVVMAVQLKYMLDKPLGYRLKDNIALPFVNSYADFHIDELRHLPVVERVGFILNYPMVSGSNIAGVNYEDKSVNTEICYLDCEAFDIMEFGIMEQFTEPLPEKVWATESLMKALQLNRENIDSFSQSKFEICGLVDDYQKGSVCSPDNGLPKILYLLEMGDGKNYKYMRRPVVRIKGDEREAVRQIREFYKAKGMPFCDRIVSCTDLHRELYASEENNLRLLLLFSLIIVLLTSLSLLAMSTYYARQHTREVAIHKIFGCGKRELFFSTALGFLRWVGVAIIAGLPVAWYLADKWLQDYPCRVDNSVWSYLVAAAVLVVVSVAAISWQVGRLVASQPVDSLKKE